MEPVIRTCPVCGNTYEADPTRLRFGRQTTCSRKCSYKLRSKKLTKGSEFVCSTCGKKFYRSPAQVKSKHQGIYCSRECHYIGRGAGLTGRIVVNPYSIAEYDRRPGAIKGWKTRRRLGKDGHSEATKERLRQATIRHISRRTEGFHVSKLENEVAKELTKLGIAFDRQVKIRNPKTGRYIAVVDFFIDDRIAVEVNGTFWHADPRVYPDGPIYDSQRRTVTRYAKKVEALNLLGVPLIELWESDLKQSIVDTIRNALHGIALG